MRLRIVLALATLAAGCGGGALPSSPTQVTPPTAPREPFVLDSGPYSLTFTLSTTGNTVCQNGICASISLCVGQGGPAVVVLPVVVQRDGDRATIAPVSATDSLRMTLVVSQLGASGDVTGAARGAEDVSVFAKGSVAAVAGKDGATAIGSLDGQLTIGGSSCSNNGHTWQLTPRL